MHLENRLLRGSNEVGCFKMGGSKPRLELLAPTPSRQFLHTNQCGLWLAQQGLSCMSRSSRCHISLKLETADGFELVAVYGYWKYKFNTNTSSAAKS